MDIKKNRAKIIKILLIVPYATGTIGRCSHNLFRALSEQQGVEAKVFLLYKTNQDTFDFGEVFSLSRIKNNLIGRLIKIFRSILLLRNIKKTWCPDVSLGTLNVCSAYNLLSGGSENKIGIFHGEFSWSTMTHKSITAFLWGRFCYRFLFPYLNWRISVSQRVLQLTESYVKSSKGNTKVIYNAHDVAGIINQAELPISKANEGIFTRDVLIAVGGLTENKGVLRLVCAFSEVWKKKPETNLLFLGKDWGEKKKALILAQKLGLERRIYFVDQVSNPYPYIKRAKLLISSSYSEGLPGVLCEAMILNVPVVATNSSAGVWEILDCFEDFNPNLKGSYTAGKGIIVQNLSRSNENILHTAQTADENEISNAILRYLTDESFWSAAKKCPSTFVERVRFRSIAKEFLKLKKTLPDK